MDTSIGTVLDDSAKSMFIVFSAVGIILCLAYQSLAIPHRYSLDYGEAPLLDQAMRLASGQMHPAKKVWSYYGGMAAPNGTDSYVVDDFPAGTTNVPVQSGQLIGYQGSWSGNPPWPKWVHITFAIIDASEQDTFPEKVTLESTLDPVPYLGLTVETGNENPQPLKCE